MNAHPRRWSPTRLKQYHAATRRKRLLRWCARLANLAQDPVERVSPRSKVGYPNLLKLARAAHEYTYRVLAQQTHMGAATLCRIENNFVRPARTDEMARIAEAVGVSPEMLFCLGRYADVAVALDAMMGFRPLQKTRVRAMARSLRRALDRARTSVPRFDAP